MEHEFKPKEWVLVRDDDDNLWKLDMFSHKSTDGTYQCIGNWYEQCIPYEGNEHLLGTSKSADAPVNLGDWKVGDKVEVQCSGDDKWYSGEIVDIDPRHKSGSDHKIMPFF
ncbi:MAG: hypothetical protein J5615_11065, partial [Fibrobacter sp.]|nr:hypothetical protein [Fibrobacter sp.]